MFSIYNAFRSVTGAEIWFIFFLICGAFYLLMSFLWRCNRRGWLLVFIGMITAGVICDAAWYLAFFPGGEYLNSGLGSMYLLLLWPEMLMITDIIITAFNISKYPPDKSSDKNDKKSYTDK